MNRQPQWFDCYQHDGSREFRIELRGYFDSSNVPDVAGTWRTAQSIMKDKEFVLDLRALHGADSVAKGLLSEMRGAGARWIVHSAFSRQLTSEVDGIGVAGEPPAPCRRALLGAWACAASYLPLRRGGRPTRS